MENFLEEVVRRVSEHPELFPKLLQALIGGMEQALDLERKRVLSAEAIVMTQSVLLEGGKKGYVGSQLAAMYAKYEFQHFMPPTVRRLKDEQTEQNT